MLKLGITKADLAKRMGMLPSSLYRKLARESMTFKVLQKCLDVLGVTIEFNLQYPNGNTRSSEANHELLFEKMELLEKEKKVVEKAEEYLEKIQGVLSNMKMIIAYALGEEPDEEPAAVGEESIRMLKGKRVLIVDDNEMNREIMKEILVFRGLEVEEAGDGYEATMKIRSLPNRIRANIPIIALTANAVPENRERADGCRNG